MNVVDNPTASSTKNPIVDCRIAATKKSEAKTLVVLITSHTEVNYQSLDHHSDFRFCDYEALSNTRRQTQGMDLIEDL